MIHIFYSKFKTIINTPLIIFEVWIYPANYFNLNFIRQFKLVRFVNAFDYLIAYCYFIYPYQAGLKSPILEYVYKLLNLKLDLPPLLNRKESIFCFVTTKVLVALLMQQLPVIITRYFIESNLPYKNIYIKRYYFSGLLSLEFYVYFLNYSH